MHRLLITLVLVAIGCAAPPFEGKTPPRTIAVESPELVAPTRAAMARWSEATGVPWTLVAGSADLVVRLGDIEGAGHYSARGIVVDQGAQFDQLELTILHELGHAFGVDHHRGHGVMNASANLACVTEADLVLVCTHFDCSTFKPECGR